MVIRYCMDLSVLKSISNLLNQLVKETIKICVDCQGLLSFSDLEFRCESCKRSYNCSDEGVWDFTQAEATRHEILSIYQEAEFMRWVDVFRKVESKNWYIYKNKLFRFFTEAGHRSLGRLLNKHITSRSLLLELGCGTGSLCKFVDCPNYVGVDISHEGLSLLKKKYPNAIAIQTSGENLPFAKSSYDYVVSLHTLEHIYRLGETLEQIREILVGNGFLFYGIPTEGGVLFRLGRRFFTGLHLRKTYDLDVNYVMDREHINDANRVLKFLSIYFKKIKKVYWPFSILRMLNPNILVYGYCAKN